MTASEFGKVLFVSVLASFVIVGTYGAWVTKQLANSAGDAVGSGLITLGVIKAPKPEQITWPVVTRAAKSDFGVMPDEEMAGDLADQAIAAEDKASSKHMLARVSQ